MSIELLDLRIKKTREKPFLLAVDQGARRALLRLLEEVNSKSQELQQTLETWKGK